MDMASTCIYPYSETMLQYAIKQHKNHVALKIIETLPSDYILIDSLTLLLSCENNMNDVALKLVNIYKGDMYSNLNNTSTSYKIIFTSAVNHNMTDVVLALINTQNLKFNTGTEISLLKDNMTDVYKYLLNKIEEENIIDDDYVTIM